MSDKKHKSTEPNTTQDEAGTNPEAMEQSGDLVEASVEMEALLKRLEEAESKVAEHLDGWQRAQAEFINYKNRVQRDQESIKSLMRGDIIKKFLPVLDDLERAMQNRPAEDSWANGIDLITRKLQAILASEGVTRIEAEGQAFDPNFHEAISHEAADGVESGHVIAVVQNGYMLGERVLRPAMVRVAQ